MEILTNLQKKIITLYSELSDREAFYLTGGTRAALRDFIDVYFLAKERFTKNELIEKAGLKDPGFDLYWLGVAMERINDFSDNSPDLHLLMRQCTMGELKEFFKLWRKEIAKEITER